MLLVIPGNKAQGFVATHATSEGASLSMAETFTTAELRLLYDFVTGSPDRLTLDLVEPDDGPATANIGRDAYGLWTISPAQLGFDVGGSVGPAALSQSITWVRPVASLAAALAIVSTQAGEVHSLVAAISKLVAMQALDALQNGGRLT
jgi:hypothetical protein